MLASVRTEREERNIADGPYASFGLSIEAVSAPLFSVKRPCICMRSVRVISNYVFHACQCSRWAKQEY